MKKIGYIKYEDYVIEIEVLDNIPSYEIVYPEFARYKTKDYNILKIYKTIDDAILEGNKYNKILNAFNTFRESTVLIIITLYHKSYRICDIIYDIKSLKFPIISYTFSLENVTECDREFQRCILLIV